MRNTLVILFAIFWVLLIVAWPRQSNEEFVESAQLSAEGLYRSDLTDANFGLLKANFYETVRDIKSWNIRSEFAELHRKDNYSFMKVVDAKFFAKNTGNVVRTNSDFGRSWLDKRLVNLEGNVEVRSRRGYLFTMDKLNYIGEKHEFRSDDMVHMKGPKLEDPAMYLQGVGMWADIHTEHFILNNQVIARKKLQSSQWLNIKSKSGEFFTEQQHAIFRGKVTSTLPDIKINSREFEMDVVEGAELLKARGEVVLENRSRIGRADSAEIQVGSNEIVLAGNALVDTSDGNQIRGNRIRLSTISDRLVVEQASGKVTN